MNKALTSRYVKLSYGAIVLLLIAHLITVLITKDNSVAASSSQAAWFDLDREYNIPTVTNAIFLALNALVCVHLMLKTKLWLQRVGWSLFALLFAYLSSDELLIIHEQLGEPLRKLLDISNSNPFYHAWVVPASAVIVIMGVIALLIRRYYKQLKVSSDTLILVAVLGAGVVALEVIGTFFYSNTTAYRLILVPTEEIFELSMAVTILSKLLGIATSNGKKG